jgi:hypothetical protein
MAGVLGETTSLCGETARRAENAEARDGSVVEQFSDDQSLKGP